MSGFPRDLFTPNSLKSKRGALWKKFQNRTYRLSGRGDKGQAYFVCINQSMGCPGRMKITPEGGKEVTVDHIHTCPTTKATGQTPAVRERPKPRQKQGQASRRKRNTLPQFAKPMPVHPDPQPGPSQAVNSDDVETIDEDTDSDVDNKQLKRIDLEQKIEINDLKKQKLQLEIDLLQQQRNHPGRNPGVNGSDAMQ